MAFYSPSWIRREIKGATKYGANGGPLFSDNDGGFFVDGTWASPNITIVNMACWAAPTAIVAADWGDSPECTPDERGPMLALFISEMAPGLEIWFKTNAALIDPANGTELATLWGAGISLLNATLRLGWNVIDFSAMSAPFQDNIRDNGLMAALYTTTIPSAGYAGSLEFRANESSLMMTYQFPFPALLAAPDDDPRLARPAEDSRLRQLLVAQSPNTTLTIEGGLRSTIYDNDATLPSITEGNTPVVGMLNREVNFLTAPSIPTNGRQTISIATLASGLTIASLESVTGSNIYLDYFLKEPASDRYRISGIGGTINSMTVENNMVELGVSHPIEELKNNEYWSSDHEAHTGRIKGVFQNFISSGYILGWGPGISPIEILFDCLMNSRATSRYENIFPDDWYWLKERYEGTWLKWAYNLTTEWAGSDYADVAEMLMNALGLRCTISAGGNLIVFNPFVYRPSARVHTINLDSGTVSGLKMEFVAERVDSVTIHGEGIGSGGTPTGNDYASEYYLFDKINQRGGNRLDIPVTNLDGTVNLDCFNSDMARMGIARCFAAQVEQNQIKVSGKLDKRGLLLEVGDYIDIVSGHINTFNADDGFLDGYFVVTKVQPSLEQTYFEAVGRGGSDFYSQIPSFSDANAPLGIWRGTYLSNPGDATERGRIQHNRTWRSTGALGNMTGVVDNWYMDQRLGSYEGCGWGQDGGANRGAYIVTAIEDTVGSLLLQLSVLDSVSSTYKLYWETGTIDVVLAVGDTVTDAGFLVVVANESATYSPYNELSILLVETSDATDPTNTALWGTPLFLGNPVTSPDDRGRGERVFNISLAIDQGTDTIVAYTNTGIKKIQTGLVGSLTLGTGFTSNDYRFRWSGYYGKVFHTPGTWTTNNRLRTATSFFAICPNAGCKLLPNGYSPYYA